MKLLSIIPWYKIIVIALLAWNAIAIDRASEVATLAWKAARDASKSAAEAALYAADAQSEAEDCIKQR